MQDFFIIRKVKVSDNFKNEKIKSIFDINKDEVIYSKNHSLYYDEMKWNIGVIYGNSGSGKTLLGNEISKKENIKIIEKNNWTDESIINNFNGDVNEVIKFLSKVGLNTQLSYLKPYKVLSNGEKMRCDLAKSIFENDFVIIDEYSSVVDRNITKIISQCIRKVILEKNKKVIFISCHNDFLNDLMPDWVYNIDTQEFLKDLPFCKTMFKFYITRGHKQDWQLFKDYHYLSASLACNSKDFFILKDGNNNKIGFCNFFIMPHNKVKMCRVNRLVILPDYQGIGLGNTFLNECCKEVYKTYKNIYISTSILTFARSLKKNKNFKQIKTSISNKPNPNNQGLRKTMRFSKISFKYIRT